MNKSDKENTISFSADLLTWIRENDYFVNGSGKWEDNDMSDEKMYTDSELAEKFLADSNKLLPKKQFPQTLTFGELEDGDHFIFLPRFFGEKDTLSVFKKNKMSISNFESSRKVIKVIQTR